MRKNFKYCNGNGIEEQKIQPTPRQKTMALSLVSTTERAKTLAGIAAKERELIWPIWPEKTRLKKAIMEREKTRGPDASGGGGGGKGRLVGGGDGEEREREGGLSTWRL